MEKLKEICEAIELIIQIVLGTAALIFLVVGSIIVAIITPMASVYFFVDGEILGGCFFLAATPITMVYVLRIVVDYYLSKREYSKA